MAPIHDTDIAEERWSQAEWDHYELWERIELKLKRRKLLLIACATIVFLLLSSVPTIVDQMPRWTALAISRRLSQEINRLKTDASITHQAYRIRFTGGLAYLIEKSARCSDPGVAVRSGSLSAYDFTVLDPAIGRRLGIPGLVSEFCYDHLSGSGPGSEAVVGIGIISAKDLTDARSDRLSILLLKGASAEVTLD